MELFCQFGLSLFIALFWHLVERFEDLQVGLDLAMTENRDLVPIIVEIHVLFGQLLLLTVRRFAVILLVSLFVLET